MKLLRVEVEHFGCIRRAAVELGPGLNVLYGPNDLGKSTLAKAIRAALLLPHTSSAAQDFVEWEGADNPSVKLTLEVKSGRIWRIEKTFGTSGGSSILRESSDGQTFSPYKKAREVDEEVRTMLGWGIASPATKNAPKGLPSSFLAQVLLGEQTDVAGVLKQALTQDSDESGKARLTDALAALAQDPVFKKILDDAQRQVDLAFTPTGRRKRDRASPFRDVTDEVKRIKAEVERLAGRVAESDAARRELEVRNEELFASQEAKEQAEERLRALKEAKAQVEDRALVEAELSRARTVLQEQETQVTELQDKALALGEASRQVDQAKEAREAADSKVRALLADEKAAEEALRRATSNEAEQARQLRRGELEKRELELQAAAKAVEVELTATTKAQTLNQDRAAAIREAEDLDIVRKRAEGELEAASAKTKEAERTLELLEVASRLQQRRKVESAIDQLEQLQTDIAADRAKAEQHRAGARELRDSIPAELPDVASLSAIEKLAHDLEVAQAKLGGGLAIVVERLAPVRLRGSADSAELDLPADGRAEFEATRGFALEIGDVAKITVTAGEKDARTAESELRARWETEGAPLLARLDCADLAALVKRVHDAEAVRRDAADAEASAKGLDERASDREGQLAKLPELREELAVIDRELEGAPSDDAASLLESLDGKSPETRRAELKSQLAEAQEKVAGSQEGVRKAESQAGILAERVRGIEEAIAALELTEPEDGWDALLGELEKRAATIADDRGRIERELQSLAAEQDAELQTAQAALGKIREARATAEQELTNLDDRLQSLRDQLSRLEGEVETRRAAVNQLDIDGSRQRVTDIEARLAELPLPAEPVTDESLAWAKGAFEEAGRTYDVAKDAVRKAEGALQTVGGQVVIEEKAAAEDALRQAERKEQDVELEYDAWRLLVDKLREAENTEGQHLGEALSKPVTERFAELTAHRYGKLEVAPNLQAEGLRVAGVIRDVSALSVGTQEQLATLLRLTVAEQLGSTLVLDDHLTQTDPARSAWFRDVLREHASKAQVVVLTCRPLDYLMDDDLPAEGQTNAIRAGGLVTATDLGRVLERNE